MTNKEQQKLQAKWERILTKKGLGIYQPMTDNSEGEMAQSDMASKAITDRTHDREHAYLRGKVDGSEQFMDGHQIMKVRAIEREIPEWAMSKKEIQRILLLVFPKMKTNKSQRDRAGKWALLIQLYYRMQQPKQVVAKELKIDDVLLTRWIQKITFVSQGLNVNGKPRVRKSSPAVQPLKDTERKDEGI